MAGDGARFTILNANTLRTISIMSNTRFNKPPYPTPLFSRGVLSVFYLYFICILLGKYCTHARESLFTG